ncbi:MAG TPA: AAA family ATPase, partial [Candidatus Saccharimonadales bacterium]
TDSQGRTVDFTNVILIATSNAATQEVQSLAKAGKTAEEIKTYLLDQKLYEYFRPEFLNRFDGVVIFKPLSMPHVEQISGLMLKKIGAQLEARGINFQVTPAAVRELAQKGYSEQFGARALRRIIQSEVQDALAKQLLSKSVSRRDTVIVDAGGQVRVEKAKPL